jgi:hypothetical protein
MSYITAEQAKTQVITAPSQEELEAKYATVAALIDRRSRQRFWTTDVTIGDNDITEFKTFVKAQGFNSWTETTSAVPLPQAVTDIQGTERTVRVSWETYTATATVTEGISPPQIVLSITTQGVTDEPTLRWTNTGTIDGATDFATEVNSGNIALSAEGTATLTLDLKATPAAGSTVKLTLKRAGSEPTTLAESATVTF